MSWLRTPQAGGRRGPFCPRLEALEDRCVPTANFIVTGNTLLVIAPVSRHQVENEQITITDNGTSGINNVTVSARAMFFPNVPITNVIVLTGPGSDRVTYNLAGDLSGQRTIQANLGGGNNSFSAFLRRNLLPGSSLGIAVNGGGGDDHLAATLIGNIGAGAQLNIALNGQAGNNVLDVFSASLVRVDPGASVNVGLFGAGRGTNRMLDEFFGTLNGSYTVFENGGVGPNRLFADLEVAPRSTGRVTGSLLHGGPGNDNLTFQIHVPVGFSADNQVLDGDGGFDTDTRTLNVIAFNTERDNVVS